MKVPLVWLQEFIDLPTTDVAELSYAFDMLGLTVESVEMIRPEWSDVLVGKVLEIAAHPDAEKIRVCQVDTGSGPTQIICGAWNFEAGAIVPVAAPGAVLPGEFEIGLRNIRGIESNGMICSERELGLGDDHAGILVLDGEPEIGIPFADIVELPDLVFDLEITPNRPDAMSMLGVARDLAAHFGIEHRLPEIQMSTVQGSTKIEVQVDDPVGCRRFTAREITGVTVGPSPFKIRHRLHKIGVRSISNVVDVTNYVMFELGHPLHAFDADSIAGARLVVRRASVGETLVTLDDEERALTPEDLIIYDDDGPTSMSGTMGGARSEVGQTTKRVLMEAASWDPPTIMYMSRRHDLRSEASTRFERGVDPNLADIANQRASVMVAALTGGEILDGAVDVVGTPTTPAVVDLRLFDVERLLGSGFTVDSVSSILTSLGMGVEDSDPMVVTVPTYRPDVTRPADLIEEVARIHGFDNFEATLPSGPSGGLTPEQNRQRILQMTLTGAGLHQAVNLPFVSMEDLTHLGSRLGESELLTVKNPLREEESKLRPTMLPGLLGAIRYNLSHGAGSVGLFEIGKVFSSAPDEHDPRLPAQPDRVAWAVVGDVGTQTLDGSSIKADGAVSLALWRRVARSLGLSDVEIRPSSAPGFHPGRTAEILIGGVPVGHVGELSPRSGRAFEIIERAAVAELDLALLVSSVSPVQVKIPSVFPFIEFDLSFLVDSSQNVSELLAAMRSAGADLIETERVFDEFVSPDLGDKKAVAIRYRLRANDRTLTNDDAGPIRAAMIDAAQKTGAVLRGA
ncbi:MAG: phenylalanine--tRNA ligase subunit beta [Acidimicrobiia bacterium]